MTGETQTKYTETVVRKFLQGLARFCFVTWIYSFTGVGNGNHVL